MEPTLITLTEKNLTSELILIVHIEDNESNSSSFVDGILTAFNNYLEVYTEIHHTSLPFEIKVISLASIESFNSFLENDLDNYIDSYIHFIVDIRLGRDSNAGFKIIDKIYNYYNNFFRNTFVLSALKSLDLGLKAKMSNLFYENNLTNNIISKGSKFGPSDILCLLMNKITDNSITTQDINIFLETSNIVVPKSGKDSNILQEGSVEESSNDLTYSLVVIEKVTSNNQVEVNSDELSPYLTYLKISEFDFRYAQFFAKSFIFSFQQTTIGWNSPLFIWKAKTLYNISNLNQFNFYIKRIHKNGNKFPCGISFPMLTFPVEFLVNDSNELEQNILMYSERLDIFNNPLEHNIIINFFLIKCSELYVTKKISEQQCISTIISLNNIFLNENNIFFDHRFTYETFLLESFTSYVWELSCFIYKSISIAEENVKKLSSLTCININNVLFCQVLDNTTTEYENSYFKDLYLPVTMKSLDSEDNEISRLVNKDIFGYNENKNSFFNQGSCFKLIRFTKTSDNNLHHTIYTYVEPILNFQFSNYDYFE